METEKIVIVDDRVALLYLLLVDMFYQIVNYLKKKKKGRDFSSLPFFFFVPGDGNNSFEYS